MRAAKTARVVPTTIARNVAEAYLAAGRLPVTLASRIARQQTNDKWPPALTYEQLHAGVETLLGKALRDEVLATRGRLRNEKVIQLSRAARLERLADEQREVADETLDRRREMAGQKRVEAEQKAAERERALEQKADEREAKAEQKAAKKANRVQATKAQQEKAIDRRERVAKSGALAKESEALAAAQQALDAERTVDVIEDTIEGEKAARKTG